MLTNTAVVWPSQKDENEMCQLSEGLPHSADTEVVLLRCGRRDFFRPQGDRGPGGVRLHCPRPGQPGWGRACSGGPSTQMSAHSERTLESDGKKRIEEKEKKRKPGSLREKVPISEHRGIYTNGRFLH